MAYEDYMQLAGLSRDQSLVYEALIKFGPMEASRAAYRAGISRTLGYKILKELEGLRLVTKQHAKGSVTTFVPAHPLRLKEIADERKADAEQAVAAIDSIFGRMTSDFNLVSGKPGVRFFEGKEGVKAVLDDSLLSKTEILSFADLQAIDTYIKDLNAVYVRDRERLGIKKRGIVLDTPFARSFLKDYYKTVTDTKLFLYDAPPFQTIMQIYDDKISYITLTTTHLTGVIIADPNIYYMHRYLFEYMWQKAEGMIV